MADRIGVAIGLMAEAADHARRLRTNTGKQDARGTEALFQSIVYLGASVHKAGGAVIVESAQSQEKQLGLMYAAMAALHNFLESGGRVVFIDPPERQEND